MRIIAAFQLLSLTISVRALSIPSSQHETRRNFFKAAIVGGVATALPRVSNADIEGVITPNFSQEPPQVVEPTLKADETVLYKTRSGLKYIILKEGEADAPSPRFGQFVTIGYTSYVKLPDTPKAESKLDKYDSDNTYLIKHGNGRLIPGLDEGLHTMKLGEKRRIIIPPKLGYIGPGVLGPLPDSPYGRYKLNKLLNEMIDIKAGNIVMDVELKNIMSDEADQGYYEDESISPEDFQTLRNNISIKAKENQAARKQGGKITVDLVGAAAMD